MKVSNALCAMVCFPFMWTSLAAALVIINSVCLLQYLWYLLSVTSSAVTEDLMSSILERLTPADENELSAESMQARTGKLHVVTFVDAT